MIIEKDGVFYVDVMKKHSIHEEDNWLMEHGVNYMSALIWINDKWFFRLPNESLALEFWTLFGKDRL